MIKRILSKVVWVIIGMLFIAMMLYMAGVLSDLMMSL